MFCRFCGTTLPDDSTFCHSCGKSLATTQANTSPVAAAPAPAPIPAPAAQRPSRNNGATVARVLGIVLALGVVLCIVNQSTSRHPVIVPTRQPRVMSLAQPAYTLNSAQALYWNFTLPANASDVRVEGTFTASGWDGK